MKLQTNSLSIENTLLQEETQTGDLQRSITVYVQSVILQAAVALSCVQGNETEFSLLSTRSSESEISKLTVVDYISLTCHRSFPAMEQCKKSIRDGNTTALEVLHLPFELGHFIMLKFSILLS